MSFQKSAHSMRARLHISAVKPTVIAGVVLATVIALAALGYAIASAGNGFSIERAAASEAAASAQGENSGGKAAEQGQTDKTSSAVESSKTASTSGETSNDGSESALFVHVGGAVATSGVYSLPAGSRVSAAVEAAGGFTDDAARDALNLARLLSDGEQVVVPTKAQVETGVLTTSASTSFAPSASGAAVSSLSSKVNLNTAGVAELDTLPGVGESTAEKIIADRQKNGSFSTVEDLKRVSGIGDKKFEQIAPLVCVG